MRISVSSICLLMALFAVGCAAQKEATPARESTPQSAPAPGVDMEASEAEQHFETLAEAEQALERAKSELQAMALLDAQPAPAEGAAPAAAAPPAPASEAAPVDAAPSRGAAAEDESKKREAQATSGPSCGNACRAFASLTRAKDAVCRLEQPVGERCARARQLVSQAEARVASCGCSG